MRYSMMTRSAATVNPEFLGNTGKYSLVTKPSAFVAFAASRLRRHLDRAANQIGRVDSRRRQTARLR